MSTLEIRLLDYIDGSLTIGERAAIEQLLATDTAAKALYDELLLLDNTIGSSLELDMPKMAFTRGVMDQIKAQALFAPKRFKAATWPVKAIAALFALMLVGLLVYVLFQVNYSDSESLVINVNFINGIVLSDSLILTFILINAVLLLVYADYLLRKHFIKGTKKGNI